MSLVSEDVQRSVNVCVCVCVCVFVIQVESQRAVLLEAKKRLETVVDRQLDEAVTRMDAQGVLRFAALYKPLGKQVRVQRPHTHTHTHTHKYT